MLDAMYEIPSQKTKKELVISASYVKTKLNKEVLNKLKVAQFIISGQLSSSMIAEISQSQLSSPQSKIRSPYMLGLTDTIPFVIIQLDDSKQNKLYFKGSVILIVKELLLTELPLAEPTTL